MHYIACIYIVYALSSSAQCGTTCGMFSVALSRALCVAYIVFDVMFQNSLFTELPQWLSCPESWFNYVRSNSIS